MALLRTRQHAPFKGDDTCMAEGKTAMVAAAVSTAQDATTTVAHKSPPAKLIEKVKVESLGEPQQQQQQQYV